MSPEATPAAPAPEFTLNSSIKEQLMYSEKFQLVAMARNANVNIAGLTEKSEIVDALLKRYNQSNREAPVDDVFSGSLGSENRHLPGFGHDGREALEAAHRTSVDRRRIGPKPHNMVSGHLLPLAPRVLLRRLTQNALAVQGRIAESIPIPLMDSLAEAGKAVMTAMTKLGDQYGLDYGSITPEQMEQMGGLFVRPGAESYNLSIKVPADVDGTAMVLQQNRPFSKLRPEETLRIATLATRKAEAAGLRFINAGESTHVRRAAAHWEESCCCLSAAAAAAAGD